MHNHVVHLLLNLIQNYQRTFYPTISSLLGCNRPWAWLSGYSLDDQRKTNTKLTIKCFPKSGKSQLIQSHVRIYVPRPCLIVMMFRQTTCMSRRLILGCHVFRFFFCLFQEIYPLWTRWKKKCILM